mgnify:FL=1
MLDMKMIVSRFLRFRPHGKNAFLCSCALKFAKSNRRIRVLDVGCGNSSVIGIKRILPKSYYIGIDVDDYNLTAEAKALMEEYHVVDPEEFDEKISEYRNTVDIVISAHNLEHCNKPEIVLKAMIAALRDKGRCYISFPSEVSVNFPHRNGTLNFYDDPTHKKVPQVDEILLEIKNNAQVLFFSKEYKPLFDWIRGRINEATSKKKKKVLAGTWAYWGFETVIWVERIRGG